MARWTGPVRVDRDRHVAAEGAGEQLRTSPYVYFFGPDAAAAAARDEPAWRTWIGGDLPAV